MADTKRPSNNRFRKKITPFLAQEMLYDFATDRLDPDRKDAIEEFLKNDKECRNLLDAIHRGGEYAEKLSGTKLKSDLVHQLMDAENVLSLGKRYSSPMQWPDSIRWSLMAIVISSLVAATVALVPWNKMPTFQSKPTDTIEIAKLHGPPEPTKGDVPPEAAETLPEDNEQHGSGDDVEDEGPEAAQAAKVVANQKQPPTPAPPPLADQGDRGREGKPVTPNEEIAKAQASAAGEKHDPKAKGFVYRAFMTLNDLETLGPKLSEQIIELGGEKAGEVELGWKRGTGRYYHFALPESNEEKILEILRAYGPVRISKDPHPRVMPKGQVRFILWVESGS